MYAAFTEPDERLGKNGIREIMSHPFFQEIDFEKLRNFQIEPPLKPQVKRDDEEVARDHPVLDRLRAQPRPRPAPQDRRRDLQ